MTKLLEVNACELSATAYLDDTALTLNLVGTADARSDAAFRALVERLHETCQRAGVREAVVDFHRLEFMNSSCIKRIITWVIAVGELPAAQRYQIRLRSDPAVSWQRRSLKAISLFGKDHVVIDESMP